MAPMRRHPQQQEGCSEKAQVEQGAAAALRFLVLVDTDREMVAFAITAR